ncbi:MAG: Uma2 family endonuclease [Oscillatoria sp. PMC 1068.18]|nr:Uma2 family endonuclease [Oscillatoria sp. PMC 1076.18]MEC4988310.1 Uma2 family endonuclease [Oscillatoria sp. PMC 1068.18]
MQPTKLFQAIRLWTVAEYHKMAEVGILQPDEPVELIAGQIIRKMSPQNSPHAAAITRSDRVLRNLLPQNITIRIQLPLQLNNYSEPEPDLAVVKRDFLDYDDRHPTAAEVYLIIEIADSTLKTDREVKALSYASSGISDYWILDLNNRQLRVFRQPREDGYQSEVILTENNSISPLAFPNLKLTVAEMLRPINR